MTPDAVSADTASAPAFPHELLNASVKQRLAYFKNWLTSHPKLIETRNALMEALQPTDCPANTGSASIIQVFGCTGVGKTTLRNRVERLLMEEAAGAGRLCHDPGCIPIVSVITPPPDQGPFSWRDVYVQTLQALDEPRALMNKKHITQLNFIPEDKVLHAPTTARPELRLALASALYHRHTHIVFFDEAQHFQRVTQAQRLQDQMDNLKWTAEVSGAQFVLIGTFDLLNLTDLSGQLARRSVNIHFDRYHAERAEEFKQFAGVVLSFQRHLPLAVEPDLLRLSEYLYERSVGCVGILKDWLMRALSEALKRGERTLTQAHLDKHLDMRKAVAVAREAATGEQRLKSNEVLYAELKSCLSLAEAAPASAPSSHMQKPPRLQRTRRRGGRVGQRRAVRDDIAPGATATGLSPPSPSV